LRKFKKISGGHLKVRDYFLHCRRHPELDPFLYFTPDSTYQSDELWQDVPRDKIVKDIQLENYEIIFVAGKDWNLLPENLAGRKIVNFIQHVKHGDPADERFSFLSRPALRICVSREAYEAIAPHISGEAVVIKNGIPLDLFQGEASKDAGAVLIWARKNPELGRRLYNRLAERRVNARVLMDYLPRVDFARELTASDIFVALPHQSEGFYLPALEAMAAHCAVVCSDAVGNRSFCIHGETCMMPEFDNFDNHLATIDRLLGESATKEKIRRNGYEMGRSYSIETERAEFYRFLDKFILS